MQSEFQFHQIHIGALRYQTISSFIDSSFYSMKTFLNVNVLSNSEKMTTGGKTTLTELVFQTQTERPQVSA